MRNQLPNPVPYQSPDNREFWTATAESRLLLRRCDDCSAFIWYPRPFCPICGSLRTSWAQASGLGSVYTFTGLGTSQYRSGLPRCGAIRRRLRRTRRGTRVLTNIIGVAPEDVRIGMPVSVEFTDTGEGSALYRFTPR